MKSMLLALLLPATASAQIAEAVATLRETPRLAVVIEATDDRPAFAAQRAERVLQNVAEVARQLGVSAIDTTAQGVSRVAPVDPRYPYPPSPYVARYVLTMPVAGADVQRVAAALTSAGAMAVVRKARREE